MGIPLWEEGVGKGGFQWTEIQRSEMICPRLSATTEKSKVCPGFPHLAQHLSLKDEKNGQELCHYLLLENIPVVFRKTDVRETDLFSTGVYRGVPQYTGVYWGVPWCTGGTSSALQCCFLFRSKRKHCGPMDAFFSLPISISVSFTVETPFILTRFSLSHWQHSVQFPSSCVWVRTFYLMTKWRQKRLPSLGPGLEHVLTAVG